VAPEARGVSNRTLGILSAIVAVLALVVIVDRPRPRQEASDRVIPGLREADLARVQIRDVVLERQGGAFAITAPRALEVEEAAVRDLLGTIEYLAWRRKVPRRDFTPRFGVTVTAQGKTIELRVGASEPATGLTWVSSSAAPGETFLVEDWQAKALDRTIDDLRRREALRAPRGPLAIEMDGKRVAFGEGCVELPGACVRADADRLAALFGKLGELVLARFQDAAPAAPRARIVAGGETLVVGGECPGVPGELHVGSAAGAGCVADEALAAILAEPLDPLAWVARTLVTTDDFASIRIVAGGQGELGIDDVASEGARAWLDELLAFRAADVELAPAAPAPGAPRIELAGTKGRQVLWIEERRGDRLRVRAGDQPLVYLVDAAMARFFVADRLPFRDRTILSFEPTALREIDATIQAARRGESIDDWSLTRPVALAADPEALETLRAAASRLRAERFVAAAPAGAHGLAGEVTLVVDPPPPGDAPPARHTVILGAATEGGCFARLKEDPAVFLLADDACRALRAPLATREVFAATIDELTAVTLDGTRYERHAGRWHRAGGAPVAARDATALEELVAALREAPEAQAYGELRPRARVVLEAGSRVIELRLAAPSYAVAGRAVRYRLAPEACAAWPTLCR
jgi:hypothetical protein